MAHWQQEVDREEEEELASERSVQRGAEPESPPRDLLVRSSLPFELRSTNDGMPTLHGTGAVYEEWTEINSRFEGHFMERFAPGSFGKTIREQRDRIRCLFHHGLDPSIGVRPLGTITDLCERGRGVEYDVDLFDADYVRSLIPGLEANQYGSSFKFGIVKKEDERKRVSNSKGLLERTIREASMRELGPTPFPQYATTTAGLRSLSDEFVLARFPAADLAAEASRRNQEPDLVSEMRMLAQRFVASGDTDEESMRTIIDLLDELTGTTTAPSEEAAPTGTSRSAATTKSTGLYGLDRGKEEKPAWLL